jgi:hypothetical protein
MITIAANKPRKAAKKKIASNVVAIINGIAMR